MVDPAKIKCVIVVDEALPAGLVANTAAVLAANVGRDHPEIFGPDVPDRSGTVHRGITALPFPVLRAKGPQLVDIFSRAGTVPELETCAFNDAAQRSTRYDQYAERLANAATEELNYLGVMLFGPVKQVNKLTGSLPLLR